MRADSARLAKAVAEVDEPERTPRARQLHRWFDGFAGELRAYHTVEDELFFPVLAERVSVIEYEVGRVEAEHAHMDAALDRTRRALETLGDGAVRWIEASRRATTTTAELHELLERQLAFEADFVLPMFVRHLTAEDYEAIDVMAARNLSLGQLPFTIPWAMANAEPCEQRLLLEGAPLSFRLLWWATRGRYRRLVHEAFGHMNGNGHAGANGSGHPVSPLKG
jgi:hypothetical protein